MLEHLGVVLRHRLRRDPRHGRDRRFDFLDADRLLALVLGDQHLARAGLVDYVDRFIRQLAIMDVARRELDRGLYRLTGIADLVELLEIGLQPLHDLHRIRDRGLVDVDLLEAADERPVLLEILPVFLVRGRADAAQRPLRQRGLQQVGCVHRAARGGAGADHGVDLVDEEDRLLVVLDLLHHLFQPLFEIAAIARAGQQRTHVEGKNRCVREHFRHFVFDDLARQAFGNRRLADARIADHQRIVLVAAAEHLDGAQNFRLASDQRIDAALARLLVEVDAIGFERAFLLLGIAVLILRIARLRRRRRRAPSSTCPRAPAAWQCRG